MDSQIRAEQSLETLQDIKRIMERSSRFISLSGLSGVSAGSCALIGAWIAHGWLRAYYGAGGYISTFGYQASGAADLEWRLVGLAIAVLAAALLSSTWFTWRRARKNNLPIWGHASKKLVLNVAIPLAAGGIFALALIYHSAWGLIAPACLVFYGLALVNASKYTLSDIRYLGLLEVLLGSINMFCPHYGLLFWTMGFGVLHIIYGLIMWWKYEKTSV